MSDTPTPRCQNCGTVDGILAQQGNDYIRCHSHTSSDRPSAPPASAPSPKDEAWTTATTSDWSVNISGLEAMGLFRRHAEDFAPRSHVYPAIPVEQAFAGLPDVQRGFAGVPEHLQPSNLPASARTVTRYGWHANGMIAGLPDWIDGTAYYLESEVAPLLTALAEAEQEICICAAIKFCDGQIARGHRHADCFKAAAGWTPTPPQHISATQGFITSRNRFVDRAEGMTLQRAAGCTYDRIGSPDLLFSEDLY